MLYGRANSCPRIEQVEQPVPRSKEVVPFMSAYLSWRTRTAISRLFGLKYNEPGPTVRGDARPAAEPARFG